MPRTRPSRVLHLATPVPGDAVEPAPGRSFWFLQRNVRPRGPWIDREWHLDESLARRRFSEMCAAMRRGSARLVAPDGTVVETVRASTDDSKPAKLRALFGPEVHELAAAAAGDIARARGTR